MISVSIFINNNPILTRSAVNSGRINHETRSTEYDLDNGSVVIHDPSQGATKLAIKMLETIKNPGQIDRKSQTKSKCNTRKELVDEMYFNFQLGDYDKQQENR